MALPQALIEPTKIKKLATNVFILELDIARTVPKYEKIQRVSGLKSCKVSLQSDALLELKAKLLRSCLSCLRLGKNL